MQKKWQWIIEESKKVSRECEKVIAETNSEHERERAKARKMAVDGFMKELGEILAERPTD